jgi:hypothetical protein
MLRRPLRFAKPRKSCRPENDGLVRKALDSSDILRTRFYVDPAMGAPHIYNHQVDEHEQSLDEASAEDEAGVASSETVMNVSHDLVSQVRELIAKHHD